MGQLIVAVDFNGTSQPIDRLLVEPEAKFCGSGHGKPIMGRGVTRTEPERLLDMRFGFLRSAQIQFASADNRVSRGQIRIDRQRPLAFENALLDPIRHTEHTAQAIVGSRVVGSQRKRLR